MLDLHANFGIEREKEKESDHLFTTLHAYSLYQVVEINIIFMYFCFILGMRFGQWQKLHVSFPPPPGSKLSLFLLYGQWFPR